MRKVQLLAVIEHTNQRPSYRRPLQTKSYPSRKNRGMHKFAKFK
ncbi:hypothetical protein D1AOALGA4SA_10107 [Olavius algarvensis Delta 1 endosymbiont]|nr:hypothetical protein D1AOALGA4SA_10107 [Olavius algarvensis Delta 1 endosymbiont]